MEFIGVSPLYPLGFPYWWIRNDHNKSSQKCLNETPGLNLMVKPRQQATSPAEFWCLPMAGATWPWKCTAHFNHPRCLPESARGDGNQQLNMFETSIRLLQEGPRDWRICVSCLFDDGGWSKWLHSKTEELKLKQLWEVKPCYNGEPFNGTLFTSLRLVKIQVVDRKMYAYFGSWSGFHIWSVLRATRVWSRLVMNT